MQYSEQARWDSEGGGGAHTFMNKFLLCSEKVLQIDYLSFLQIITRFTCVCAFFVVSLRTNEE